MEAKKFNIKESELFDNDDFLAEADGEDNQHEEEQKRVSPEQIRIDSLKLALKIIKMFDKVTAEDLLNVSSQVSSYLINHQAGTEYDATDLDLGGNKDSEESDSTEDLENGNDEDINLDDMDDFTIEDADETETPESNDDESSDDEPEEKEKSDDEDTNESDGLLPDEFVI